MPLRGQEIFLNPGLGKCNLCHENAGANANIPAAGIFGNANFNTGVEELPDQPADLIDELVPPDDGFGRPGDGTFNTPSLAEAADTGPFFHNNSVETIEGAVAFYSGDAFNNSPSGAALAGIDPNGVGIGLDATQTVAVAAFLRVINALENIRESIDLLTLTIENKPLGGRSRTDAIDRSSAEIADAMMVLTGGGLHPDAVQHLERAQEFTKRARRNSSKSYPKKAIRELEEARTRLVEDS